MIAVDIGMHVDLELITESGEVEGLALDIVPDNAANYAKGLLGASTPLARALVGHTAGSRVIYQHGDIRFVRILAVHPCSGQELEDLSSQRQAAYQKAVDQSNKTNMLLAASSMNSKWGAYDLAPLDGDEDSREEASPPETPTP
jgi:hypothetical protein